MSFCSLFIGLEHIHVTLKYTGGGRGGGGEGCLVALRKMLPDIVIPQQKKIIALGGMINIFVKTPHLLYS